MADPVSLSEENVYAQHEETGRMWSGPRSQLPPRYFVLSVQQAIGHCERNGGHDFGPNPDPDGTRCRNGCGGVFQL